jgi:hypothetical protein
MTSTERLNLARNVQALIRALQAAIDRLTEMGAHYELTAISRALARLAPRAQPPQPDEKEGGGGGMTECEEEFEGLIEISHSIVRHLHDLDDLLRCFAVASKQSAETLQIVEEGMLRLTAFIEKHRP